MMQRNLVGSFEGEIVACQPKIKGDRKNIIRYTCLVTFSDGVKVIPNVRQSSMLGGIADYWRRRATATKDDSESTQALGDNDQPGLNATVGERVIITFLNGNIANPVITGYLQHENQGMEQSLDEDKPDVNAVFQYLGIRCEINNDGELTLIHKGKPEISFVPQGSPASAGILNAVASTEVIGGNNSPAIKPAPKTEITLLEFLNGGVFRLRDEEGQVIAIDRTNKTILISNNNQASTDKELLGLEDDAEYVKFDKGAKELTVSARDSLILNSNKDAKVKVGSDLTMDVTGDVDKTVGGDETNKFKGALTESVEKDWEVSVNGSTSIISKSGISIQDGSAGKLSIKNGKVSLAGTGAEVLDLISQTLMQLINITTEMINPADQNIGNLGYLTVLSPSYTAMITQYQTSLTQIKSQLDNITG